MKIKILGTVSPYCKGNLNCPGYLVNDYNHKILLDCGNGITRNLNLPNDLENLIIIISHLHKDHYGDLLAIGYASYVYKNLGILKKKIKVYIPDDANLEDYKYINNFGDEHYLEFINYSEKNKIKLSNLEISFSKNPHQIKTYSIKIQTKENTVVYSSDTGYKDNTLTTFSKNADILICESTFLNGQKKTGNNHLYAEEAAEIALKANVKKLILTHFFPEIDKNEYVKEAKKIFKNTIAAEENNEIEIEV